MQEFLKKNDITKGINIYILYIFRKMGIWGKYGISTEIHWNTRTVKLDAVIEHIGYIQTWLLEFMWSCHQ
jgi:hypothetical protein